MDGNIFWLAFLIVCLAIVCVTGLLLRDCPTDRSAIGNFAEQRGLRIISVTRSYNFFRYSFRGIHIYEVIAEDTEGSRGEIHFGFDSMFGPGRLVVLEQQGLALTSPDVSASATQPVSVMMRLRRQRELLLLFVTGAGFGGFIVGGILHTVLSAPERPVFPDPALGYTHVFKAKYGYVYGTFFEYFAVTYGFWMMWIVGVVSIVLFRKIEPKSRTYPRYPWQAFAATAISMVLYYAIWRACIYAARS